MKIKDISGQRFGRLIALYKLNNYHKKRAWWLCVCDCGNLVEISGITLRSDHTKSCGCLNHEPTNKKHGKCYTRLYKLYKAIIKRCYNPNIKQFKDYGGRGITVCDEWRKDFMTFYDWSMSHGYNDRLTIDRIYVNGNYEPSNCRWVDMKTQQRNKRNNKIFTINGETHCLMEWCEMLNMNYGKVNQRINKLHWTIEKALELEV